LVDPLKNKYWEVARRMRKIPYLLSAESAGSQLSGNVKVMRKVPYLL
jgi:hypothetical protein